MTTNGKCLRVLILAATLMSPIAQANDALTIDVHRNANCGCCKKWIEHLKANGFTVVDHVEKNMSVVKQQLGVPPRLSACHTGVINGKFVEGHVPAEQVVKLLKRDDLLGIAVPGMPAGSPGMEMGGKLQAYKVIGLTPAGGEQSVAQYPTNH